MTLHQIDLPHGPELDAVVRRVAAAVAGEPTGLVLQALMVVFIAGMNATYPAERCATLMESSLAEAVCGLFQVTTPGDEDEDEAAATRH